jgi:hypothetical protein
MLAFLLVYLLYSLNFFASSKTEGWLSAGLGLFWRELGAAVPTHDL